MIVTQAPHKRQGTAAKTIFLAGSIDMGTAPRWQDEVLSALVNYDVEVFNPRRDDWKPEWTEQDPHFKEQVMWEMENLESADLVLFYFVPGSQSPISLLELGLVAGRGHRKVLVCCPPGFWRKGNVDVVCERHRFYRVDTLDELISATRSLLL